MRTWSFTTAVHKSAQLQPKQTNVPIVQQSLSQPFLAVTMLKTAARETNYAPVLNKLIPSTDSAFGRTAVTSCSVTTFYFYIIQSQNSPARYQLTEHVNWQRYTRSSI